MKLCSNILLSLVYTYSFVLVFKKIGAYKGYDVKLEKLLIIGMVLMDVAFLYLFNESLEMTLYYSLMFVAMYFVYSKNNLLLCSSYIKTLAIFLFVDNTVWYLFYKYTDYTVNPDAFRLLIIYASICIAAIAISIPVRRMTTFKFDIDIKIREAKLLSYFVFFIIAIFEVIMYCFEIVEKNEDKYYIYFIVLFFSFIFINYIVAAVFCRIYSERMENKLLKENLKHLKKDITAADMLRHDYRNIMVSLSGYVKENDLKGLEKFCCESLDCCVETKNHNVSEIDKISNGAVRALLSSKISQVILAGIDIDLTVIPKINDFILSDIDICRILGILIDNSIEASMEADIKIISICIVENLEEIGIVISNSYKNRPCVHKICKQSYSTKPDNSGLGLYIVEDIINNNYSNVDINTFVEEGMFYQEIIIYN